MKQLRGSAGARVPREGQPRMWGYGPARARWRSSRQYRDRHTQLCSAISPAALQRETLTLHAQPGPASQIACMAPDSQTAQDNPTASSIQPVTRQGIGRTARAMYRSAHTGPYLHFTKFTSVPKASGFVKKALSYHNRALMSGEWTAQSAFQALRILRCARLMLLDDQGQVPIWQPVLARRLAAPLATSPPGVPQPSPVPEQARSHDSLQPPSAQTPHLVQHQPDAAHATLSHRQTGRVLAGWHLPSTSGNQLPEPASFRPPSRSRRRQVLWLSNTTGQHSQPLPAASHEHPQAMATTDTAAHGHTHSDSHMLSQHSQLQGPGVPCSADAGSGPQLQGQETHLSPSAAPTTAHAHSRQGARQHRGSKVAVKVSKVSVSQRQPGRVRLRARPVWQSGQQWRMPDVTAGGHRPLVFRVQKLLAGPMPPSVLYPVANTTQPQRLGRAITRWLLRASGRHRAQPPAAQPSPVQTSLPQSHHLQQQEHPAMGPPVSGLPHTALPDGAQPQQPPQGRLLALDCFGRRAPLVSLQALLIARDLLRGRGSDLSVVLLSVPRRAAQGATTVVNRFIVFECAPGQPSVIHSRSHPSIGFRAPY